MPAQPQNDVTDTKEASDCSGAAAVHVQYVDAGATFLHQQLHQLQTGKSYTYIQYILRRGR